MRQDVDDSGASRRLNEAGMSEQSNPAPAARLILDTAAMAWQPSPSPTVWRKRLERVGPAESGRVTSLVRYEAGSVFPPHPHPDGEEILVLDGTFSDEHGDYPAGTFLLNPEGFVHAPFSRDGCLLFVKLRQYPGRNRRHVAIDTDSAPWQAGEAPGIERLALYAEPGYPERISLLRLAPGSALASPGALDGAEIFVLSGALESGDERFGAGTWLRLPPGDRLDLGTSDGALCYLKENHAAPASGAKT